MKISSIFKGNWFSQLLLTLSLVFLAFGLFNLGWFAWPSPTDAIQLTVPEGILKGAPSGTTYASLADYHLNLSWPRWLHVEQEGLVKVSLVEIEDSEANVMVARPAQVVVIEPALAELAIEPPGRMQASLAADQSLEMTWTFQAHSAGEFPGKVVVSFGFFDQSSEELVTVPIAVVDIVVRVISLWGNQPQLALWLGGVGMVFWGALFVLGRLVQVRT